MATERSSPPDPPQQQPAPPNGRRSSTHRTWTQLIANLARVAGIVVGTVEGLGQKDPYVMMFAALCVLGVDVAEAVLLRLIDRVFGDRKA